MKSIRGICSSKTWCYLSVWLIAIGACILETNSLPERMQSNLSEESNPVIRGGGILPPMVSGPTATGSYPYKHVSFPQAADHATTTLDITAGPIASIESATTHDFGSLNPFTRGEHTFFVRNAGDKPLVLGFGEITCRCAKTTLPKEPISPGELGDVIVVWSTKDNNKRFAERVQITTNDPSLPTIDYCIQGNVLVQFGAEPNVFSIPVAHPGRIESATTTLTSQTWDDFKIVDFTSSLDGVTWTTNPSTPSTNDRLKAKSSRELTVSIPDTLPQGPFSHWVRVKIEASDGAEKEYEIPLIGKVARRVAVYGNGIDNSGTLKLGIVPREQGKTHKLFVQVRDTNTELKVKRISTTPDFVSAELQPYLPNKKKGVYKLNLEIPKGAKPCDYVSNAGSLKIEFEHPRIDSLDLQLEFAVTTSIARR